MAVETVKTSTLHTKALEAEFRRRFVVRYIFFIYLLSLLEGPLRKWFLPDLAMPLTLLRDPFVILLYGYCFKNNLIWTRGIASFWLIFAAVTSVAGLAQYGLQGFAPQYWILGVRTYWLYMPLAFIVAKAFRPNDVLSFLRMTIVISIPYALLVAQQYSAPPSSTINIGVGGDEGGAVSLSREIVRPFGLFTYTGPNVLFTASMIAMFMAFYLSGAAMRYKAIILLLSGAAVGTMSVLTGSRSIYLLAAIIVGLSILGLMVTQPSGRSFKRIIVVLGFVGLAAILLASVFPDMLEAMTGRFEQAEQIEGSIGTRLYDVLFGWTETINTAPLLGAGIGAGAPGVAQLLGLPPLIYGESDLQRNLNELGLISGLAMLTLRFATATWIVILALRASKRGVAMALPLAGFVYLPMFLGQITHSPLSAFEVWLFSGLVISIEKSSQQVKRK